MAMANLDVLDYSWGRPDHGTVKAYGVRGCMRYLFQNGKGLTSGEVALFRSSGLSLGLNYEAGAGDFTGYGIGQAQARQAEGLAAALGLGGNVIIFSADWDVSRSQQASVGDALQGAMDVKGRGKVGIYGSADLVDYCYSRFGSAAFYWQTYAWSNGRLSQHADLYQWRNGQKVGGADVDFNQIVGRTFWAVGSNGTSPAGNNSTPLSEEDDMTPEQAQQLNAVDAATRDAVAAASRMDAFIAKYSPVLDAIAHGVTDAVGAASRMDQFIAQAPKNQ